jgi:hypothetical protein
VAEPTSFGLASRGRRECAQSPLIGRRFFITFNRDQLAQTRNSANATMTTDRKMIGK